MMEWLGTIEGSAFSTWLRESGSIWAYPTVLTLHTVGLGILVGAHWVLALRFLGAGAEVPPSAFERLFRYMWAGFSINLASGTMLLAADAATKASQRVFWVKMAFVLAGVVLVWVTRRSIYPRGHQLDTTGIPSHGRRLAVAAFVVWIGAITAGRLMAYL